MEEISLFHRLNQYALIIDHHIAPLLILGFYLYNAPNFSTPFTVNTFTMK